MDSSLESRLQVDIIGSSSVDCMASSVDVDLDLEVTNSHKFPVHVMDIEILIEDAGREERERKAVSARLHHSCIVEPRSSKIVRVPLAALVPSLRPTATPFMLKANVSIKDRIHGACQVSTERVRQMFFKSGGGGGGGERRIAERKRFDGEIQGLDVRTNFPKEVVVAFDMQVKNSNFLPLKFLHADFTVKSGDTTILQKKVPQHTTISSKSSAKIKMTLAIPIETIRNSFPDGLPSAILPVKMDIQFWFKEVFYGLYKIDARKTTVLVVPEAPVVTIHRVVFTFVDKKPAARLELEVRNNNNFDLQLKSLEYQALSRETSSALLTAMFKDDDTINIPGNQSVTIAVLSRPGSHDFGAVLWKLYSGEPDYLVKTSIEADTDSLGKFVFHS